MRSLPTPLPWLVAGWGGGLRYPLCCHFLCPTEDTARPSRRCPPAGVPAGALLLGCPPASYSLSRGGSSTHCSWATERSGWAATLVGLQGQEQEGCEQRKGGEGRGGGEGLQASPPPACGFLGGQLCPGASAHCRAAAGLGTQRPRACPGSAALTMLLHRVLGEGRVLTAARGSAETPTPEQQPLHDHPASQCLQPHAGPGLGGCLNLRAKLLLARGVSRQQASSCSHPMWLPQAPGGSAQGGWGQMALLPSPGEV